MGKIRVLTEAEGREILSRYPKESIQQIAKDIRAWTPTVRKFLVANNIPIRVKTCPDEIVEKIRFLLETTRMTRKDICKQLNIGAKSYDRLVKKFGLKRIHKIQYERTPYRKFIDIWVEKYGKEEADKKWAAYLAIHSKNSSGENNPMYGKPSPNGSGNGWKGRYKGHYFRSLRELCFMIRMDNEGKEWATGETLSIGYQLDGRERTYRPDFIVGTDIYEIKPQRLINRSKEVAAKKTAAEKYCEENGLKYHLVDEPINTGNVSSELLFKENLKFSGNYKRRFVHYIKQKAGYLKCPFQEAEDFYNFKPKLFAEEEIKEAEEWLNSPCDKSFKELIIEGQGVYL